ncbi:MAG: hypothetical protein MZU95_02115 [Desulfomicrobium escambiense]|nr:hypothetical protein [Desulfomicrobium escambiense]
MTREEIERQLEDFKARGIGGAFIHPRPGLITPYLSDEWFALCAHAVETGKALGLKIWLYDENSYPVRLRRRPRARGHARRRPVRPEDAQVRRPARPARSRPAGRPAPDARPASRTSRARSRPARRPTPPSTTSSTSSAPAPSPWHGGFTYVDIMRKDVTEKFLDLTLNGYKARDRRASSARPCPASSRTRPRSPRPAAARPSTTPRPCSQAFQTRWGYDLKTEPRLASTRRPATGSASATISMRPCSTCSSRTGPSPITPTPPTTSLVFTGHYWEHEWPRPRVSPDSLAMAAYAHMPGIDILMNECSDATDAQFGNARAVREIRSAANQHGRERTMSETYGAGGWDLTFADQKRIGDWEYALGVNFLNQHLSYATIKGARKRDHPLSFSDRRAVVALVQHPGRLLRAAVGRS